MNDRIEIQEEGDSLGANCCVCCCLCILGQ